MLADGIGVPCGGFAAVDGIKEVFYGWLVKEESGFGVENGFQRTAPTKGDYGFPAGYGFYRRDAKVFFARQDEGRTYIPLEYRFTGVSNNRLISANLTISSNFARVSDRFIPRIALLRKIFFRPVSFG